MALRGYTFGLDVVGSLSGELRYHNNLSITRMRSQLQTDSNLSICIKEVALLCEVFRALVTTVARQDPELIGQLRTVGSLVLAIDGVQPEKSHETLYMLRDVCSGRVLVAKTLLSSATSEIELLIDEVLVLGRPIVGVISDKQESICLAVQHKLLTVPHQICQYHYLKDVAQPICEADRHFKKELKKKVRRVRDIERQRGQSPTKEAQIVADYSLAIRTVMRDDGKYPLDPPEVRLHQKLQLMAASVERVKAAHPSALLKRLSRMLSVLNLCQKGYEQLVMFFDWIHQIAHLLHVQTSCQEAQAQLLEFIQKLKHSLPTELLRVVPFFEKITVAFAPHLFDYLKQPLLPRTNKDLELFIGRIKKSRRHITGRKNTQEFILREGSAVAMLFGLPQPNNWVEAFSQGRFQRFSHHTLNLLRQTDKRSKCWQARHDLGAFLASLEQP